MFEIDEYTQTPTSYFQRVEEMRILL
jgi:hypothetical protein